MACVFPRDATHFLQKLKISSMLWKSMMVGPLVVFDPRLWNIQISAGMEDICACQSPGSVSQWLTSCLPQTDTCCVSWQVGSWGSWSRDLLLLRLLLLLEFEPRGQIHFTPYNPWLCAPVPPGRLKCKTKPTSVHRLSKLVKVLSCAEMS